jgi:hypothetical protein
MATGSNSLRTSVSSNNVSPRSNSTADAMLPSRTSGSRLVT